MGATERIAELMKSKQEREVREVLDFAEFLIAKRERDKTDAFAVLEKYAGAWSGKFNREDAYAERKVLR